MSCRSLADTGLGAPVLVVLVLAAVLLLVGGAWVLRARRSGGGRAAVLLVVLLVGSGLAVGLTPAPAAYAAPPRCPAENGSEGTAEGRGTEAGGQVGASEEATGPDVVEEETESEGESPLTFMPTSDLQDLAPGVAPARIAGTVVNDGPEDVYVGAVTVEIVAVVPASRAAVGPCDATDYVLHDPRMPVGRAVAPNGGRATYEGAAIGFNNKSTNQDACQGATVRLRYLTSD